MSATISAATAQDGGRPKTRQRINTDPSVGGGSLFVSSTSGQSGYGFKQLPFSPATGVLVVQAQSAGKNWRCQLGCICPTQGGENKRRFERRAHFL